jgi:hypothetical protein
MHAFGWAPDDYDRIAAGVVAGHINECGAQASGGNSMIAWRDVPDLSDVGYPIIEAHPDGTFIVTKHDGTGGLINPAVVAEQILYEMGDPRTYITPDVVADFTTINLEDAGPNRVRVHGVKGSKPTDMLKVSISYSAGYKAVGTLVYAWPDAAEKAMMADRVLRERLDRMGMKFDEIRCRGEAELIEFDAGAAEQQCRRGQQRLGRERGRDREPAGRRGRGNRSAEAAGQHGKIGAAQRELAGRRGQIRLDGTVHRKRRAVGRRRIEAKAGARPAVGIDAGQ